MNTNLNLKYVHLYIFIINAQLLSILVDNYLVILIISATVTVITHIYLDNK